VSGQPITLDDWRENAEQDRNDDEGHHQLSSHHAETAGQKVSTSTRPTRRDIQIPQREPRLFGRTRAKTTKKPRGTVNAIVRLLPDTVVSRG
jgi:hypothetical protein